MNLTEFEGMRDILKMIIFDDQAFDSALKTYQSSLSFSDETKKIVASTVGAALRHYYVFEHIKKEHQLELNENETCAFYLLLANHLFVKKVNSDSLFPLAKSSFADKDVLVRIKDLIDGLEIDSLIDKNINSFTPEYLSLRYNTPSWLIKMWAKHFSKGIALKILKANNKLPLKVYRVNSDYAKIEEVLNDYENYAPSPIQDVVIKTHNSRIKDDDALANYDLFKTSMGLKYVLDQFNDDIYENVAVYQGEALESLPLEVLMKITRFNSLDIIVENQRDYNRLLRQLRKYSTKNTYLYLNNGLPSFASYLGKKVDYFFLMPKSSNFNAIRKYPDFFIHFKQSDLDLYIQKERMLIEESLKYVNDGGRLVYIVSTISNKEGRRLIEDVISQNDNLSLEEERQLFPFENLDTSLYYAVIKKEESKDD